MNYFWTLTLFFFLFPFLLNSEQPSDAMKTISLPDPLRTGDTSIEETLQKRRSVRSFSGSSLAMHEMGQLAWAAQGITQTERGFRTAPSAGATFPIEVYFIVSGNDEIPDGLYHYRNSDHTLIPVIPGDLRDELSRAALRQESILSAPVTMIITGVLRRTEQRYGERALRYMHMEAGHVAQNVYLQGVALGVGTVVIGAFNDQGVSNVLQRPAEEYPLYIMPLGYFE